MWKTFSVVLADNTGVVCKKATVSLITAVFGLRHDLTLPVETLANLKLKLYKFKDIFKKFLRTKKLAVIRGRGNWEVARHWRKVLPDTAKLERNR